ncbi:MAG TPA: DNA-deoxyinosine glycosylase [Polaromonas sp.]|jgi:hypoxanthine-DNA glycosylase
MGNDGMTAVLTGLPPLVCSQTRLLILGSFPGAASLAAQQYYGHPQNHFWKILQAIWPDGPIGMGADSYKIRSEWLLSKQLGLWDVYAACEREGSLDSSIRHAVVNDFAAVRRLCPQLQAIGHNGGESFKHSRHTLQLGLPVYKLPSTSPANASWSFERKLSSWREVFEKHGLI